jgi:hypothetical protein
MMKWMECRATRREIDEAGEQLSAQALRHVASCGPCLAFQDERARLRELLTSLEPVTAPADFDFRLRARIAAQTEELGPRSVFSGFALSTPAIAVAALVIVALGVSIVWIEQRGAKQAPTATVNSSSQDKAGNPTTAESLPPNKSADEPDPTTADLTAGINPNAPNYPGRKPQVKDPGLSQSGRYSRDLSASSAPSIKQGRDAGDVYVSAPVKPMVLSLQDDNGATRRISLPPVSFGSQRLLVGSRVGPVSPKNDRVW